MLDKGKGEVSGLPTDIFIMVLIDYVVMSARPGGARLAIAHIRTCDLLQFDSYVLHHMTQPGSLAFAHAPDEPTGGVVRTAMLLKASQIAKQTTDEVLAEAHGWPFFQDTQVDGVPNDRKMGMNIRSLISDDRLNFHRMASCSSHFTSTAAPSSHRREALKGVQNTMHCNNNRWLIHLLYPRLMQRIFSEAE